MKNKCQIINNNKIKDNFVVYQFKFQEKYLNLIFFTIPQRGIIFYLGIVK